MADEDLPGASLTGPDPELRLSRRTLLKGGAALSVAALVPGLGAAAPITRLAGSNKDGVTLAPELTHDVVVRWGDALFADAPDLDARAVARGALLDARPGTAARQFGYNADAVHFFPIAGAAHRGIVCVNHEYTNAELFLPGIETEARRAAGDLARFLRRHPQMVALAQAMHGVSVTVIERDARSRWQHLPGTPHARRVTGNTPCVISGPARGHRLLRSRADPAGVMVLGTLANCAGGQTPWGTFLTAEENVDDYFGNGAAIDAAEAALAEAHRRMPPHRTSAYGWEAVDPRFDLGHEPTELLRFGWVVEIDPYDPGWAPRKRTALGRCKHESASVTQARDGRVVVYTGDDDRFEYLYKFVSHRPVHPTDRAANRDLLDHGTLYVARFDAHGGGRWLPLVQGTGPLVAANGFDSQGDVVLRVRAAADLVGATPMDRPEDVAPDGATGRVYVALTNNLIREPASRRDQFNGREVDFGPNAANPRGPNTFGHVIEIVEEGGDCGATAFAWTLFLEGGDATSASPFGSPDNLALGRDGELWMVTDGDQPRGTHNGCYVVATREPGRGQVRQVMSAPRGAEVCGCEFTPDGRALLLTIQHPGEGGSLAAPVSHWPDGPGHAPRPALIALRRLDGEPL